MVWPLAISGLIHAAAIAGIACRYFEPEPGVNRPGAAPLVLALVADEDSEPTPAAVQIIPEFPPPPRPPELVRPVMVSDLPTAEAIPADAAPLPATLPPEFHVFRRDRGLVDPAPTIRDEAPRERRWPPEPPPPAAHVPLAVHPAPLASSADEPDVPPRKLAGNRPPPYPAAARSAGAAGVVTLRVTIAASGEVTRLSLHRSSGFAELDEAAMAAVRDWRYAPASRGGVAIDFEALVPVRFRIR